MNSSDWDRIINLASKNTEKGARVLAKVFYKTLRKKGFSVNQIIEISTNILGCLIESLNGYEKKMDHVKGDRLKTVNETSHKDIKVPRTYTKFGNNRYENDYENDNENDNGIYTANL